MRAAEYGDPEREAELFARDLADPSVGADTATVLIAHGVAGSSGCRVGEMEQFVTSAPGAPEDGFYETFYSAGLVSSGPDDSTPIYRAVAEFFDAHL